MSSTGSPVSCSSSSAQNELTLDDSKKFFKAHLHRTRTMPHSMQQPSQSNHYIEDSQRRMTAPRRTTVPAGDLGPSTSTRRMELISHAPSTQNVYHNFPHIIIAGQPFYLIPSNPEHYADFETADASYAYPQHSVPIYEEIDPSHEEEGAEVEQKAVGGDDYSVQSDQCEAGSDTNSMSKRAPVMAAPALQPRPHAAPRLVVNPLPSDHRPQQARLPFRSPASSSSTGSSSIYYYSDTLKNRQPAEPRATIATKQRLSDDFSDSGFSHRSSSANGLAAAAAAANRRRSQGGGGGVKSSASSPNSSASSIRNQPVMETKVVSSSAEEGSTLV